MKKNKMMRLASILLVCVLLTTSVIGGTFAKYVTTAGGSDSARVAHWGFEATTENTLKNLFNTNSDTGILSSDKTADGKQLIAPGSTGTVTFTFVNESDATTAPEVAYKITVDTNGSSDLSDELEAALVFKLDNGADMTWTELLAAIEALSGDASGSKEYAAGTAVPAAFGVDKDHTITWTWAFERTGMDATDTAMGNKLIAALETLTLQINVTVEQIDTYPST